MSFSVDGYVFADPPPYEVQKQAWLACRDRPMFALHPMDMGTGKSRVVCDKIGWLKHKTQRKILAIVVAPAGVHLKWMTKEFPTWLPSARPIVWVNNKQGRSEWEEGRSDIEVRCVTADTFSTESTCLKGLRLLVERAVRSKRLIVLVVDESHMFKSPSAKRTKRIQTLAKRCDHKILLSGTPIGNGLEDLYSQYRILDWEIIGCRTFTEFKTQYCVMGGFGGYAIQGYRDADKLISKIRKYSFAASKEDWLDLPGKTYDTIPVEVSEEQRRLYTKLRDEMILETKEGPVDVPLAITRILRLQQILGGHLGEGKDTTEIDCPRIRVALDLVEQTKREDRKSVIWVQRNVEGRRLTQEFEKAGLTVAYYSSNLTADERHRMIQDFQAGKYDTFVSTEKLGGTGTDLFAASVTIYFTNGYSYLTRSQSEDRVHRIGQTKNVVYYDLHAKNTVDDLVLESIRRKSDLASMLKAIPKEFEEEYGWLIEN